MAGHFSAAARSRLNHFAGRRIGIVGLGREGVDLVRFLSRWGAESVVSDSATPDTLRTTLAALDGLPVRYLLGNQRGRDLLDCSEVFVSPGVPKSVPVVAEAAAAGIPVSSATRLFFELCPGPILGVTGSSGKTTTTALTGSILSACGIPAVVGGNIGTPMLGYLERITPPTWSVLELSSFQLEDMTQSPTIGIILNIAPNHLDRHPNMADYVRSKGNLVRFQQPDDVAILNADDPIVQSLPHGSQAMAFSLMKQVDGAWLEGDQLLAGGTIWTKKTDPGSGGVSYHLPPTAVLTRAEVPLRGLHNVANVLAATTAALAADCQPDRIADGIRTFHPVDHRLEVVAVLDGVTYVNDSIATSPDRSMAALRSFEEPLVLIAGGRDKHLPMQEWAHLIGQRARGVVLVGEAASQIESALASAGVEVPVAHALRFAEVVPLARSLAHPGDVVLLAPGCTSFDEFRDYEARGEAFRAAVQALGEEDPT